jgi:activator of HSP90 ATPase
MPDAFRLTSTIPGLPERAYSAWLDAAAHAAFTKAVAKVDPAIGGKFSTLDGYAHGRTVDLLIGRKIVQTWRTREFPPSSPDSRLEIQFEAADGATRVTILHSALPDGHGEKYKKTWMERYF